MTSEPRTPTVPDALGRTSGTPVVAVLVAALGCWLLWFGAHESSLVTWSCAAGRCASDDPASAAPVAGALLLAGAGALLAPVARWASPGLVVAAGCGALLRGWSDAVRDHLNTDQNLRLERGIATGVLVVAVVVVVAGAVPVVRRSGLRDALRGRRSTWARLRDHERVDERWCRATVHFDDHDGVRHAVRTTVPQAAFAHAPRVWFDPARPDDPERVRVVVPPQPLSAAGRVARDAAVRALLPLPGDDRPGAGAAGRTGAPGTASAGAPRTCDPGAGVVEELERLHALHSAGALTDAEFAAAKRRVLDAAAGGAR